MVLIMEDVAAILNRLRMAAGFSEVDTSRVCPDAPERRPDSQAVALAERVANWAGSDPERWKRVHTAVLRIYAPVWERVDARDILVAWAGAWVALTQAKRELKRLEDLRRPLINRECDAKRGRQADVSFWGRLARRLQAQVPGALADDAEAAKALAALVSKHEVGGND